MLDTAAQACGSEPTILCFALRCNDDERRRRWIDLTSQQQVKLGSEVETLDKTKTIGNDAEAAARSILHERQVRTIWSQEKPVAGVVDEIQREILDMVVPGPSPIFPSLRTARDAVQAASQVLPELQTRMPQGFADFEKVHGDGDLNYPVPVIIVEGLDGTGKTTLARRLVEHLGSNTVLIRSPPEVLTNARVFLEKVCEKESESSCQLLRNSKAFQQLKRAFFTFGNYVLAEEILHSKTNSSAPVIVDRFASSTLAYTWGSSDAEQHTNYLASLFWRILDFVFPFHKSQGAVWPDDLPKPKLKR